jgi:hypothetical protein
MKRTLQISLVFLVLGMIASADAQVTKIRQIDFKNFMYAWDDPPDDVPGTWHWITSSPQSRIRISKGIHHFYAQAQDEYEREHAPSVSVDSVTYGDLVGDRGEEAVVYLNYSTGGTANWGYLYVYGLKNDRPALLARMETGSRADGGLVKVSVQNGSLVVDFADKDRRVGDCCSEGYIRVRYRWQKGEFIEVGTRERGDLELHKGPPTVR